MPQMLGAGHAHLRPQQFAAAGLGVHMQLSGRAQHGHGARLLGEVEPAGSKRPPLQRLPGLADHGNLRIGEGDGQRHATAKARRAMQGIEGGDEAFVGRLVQHLQLAVHVAGEIHRQVADLQGVAVEVGQAAGVERHAQRLKPKAVGVGAPPHGCQHGIDLDRAFAVVHDQRARSPFAQIDGAAQMERKFGADAVLRLGLDDRIGQRPEAFAQLEAVHVQAQPCQRLPQFEADHPQPDHGDAARQIGALEQVVGGENAVAKRLPRLRHHRTAAGGDENAVGGDDLFASVVVGDDDATRPVEPGPPGDVLRRLQAVSRAQHPGHARIAVVAHPLQHGGQIDLEPLAAADAQGSQLAAAMKVVGRLDQRLGRHAAHSGAGGAVGAVVDDDKVVGVLAHLRQRGEPGCAGAKDGDMNVTHGGTPVKRTARQSIGAA